MDGFGLKKVAIHSYRSPPKPGYGFRTATMPPYAIRNGYSSVSYFLKFINSIKQLSLKDLEDEQLNLH